MSIDAGRLRHRVRIEQREDILDSNGDVWQDPETGATHQVWVEVGTVWAAVEPVSAREFMQSRAMQAEMSARIVIRPPSEFEINATMRAVHTRIGRPDVIYSIHGALPDLDSGLEYLTLPVSTGVNDGE